MLKALSRLLRRWRKADPAPSLVRKIPTISIGRADKSDRDHIILSNGDVLCGTRQDLTPVDAVSAEQFDAWVVEEPRGAHGWRRGLCVGCRHRVAWYMEQARKAAAEQQEAA